MQAGRQYGTQKCVLLLDCWPVHKTDAHMKAIASYGYIIPLFVPPNCTSKLQPMDIGVQRPLKCVMRSR